MWDSLLKIRALPDDITFYCGHEYTQANIKFALTIEPENPALEKRAAEVEELRAAGKPTLPQTLGSEKAANVFLRADMPSVADAVGMSGKPAAEVFTEIRARKNKF
jgi:hydroxyacylglutathione hydrolase